LGEDFFLEFETMSNIHARIARIGFLALAAAMILTAGLAGDAAARHRVHTAHFRGLNARAQYVQSVPVQESEGPAVMRYYGGPKSPMWREVR
jgi:poly(3-hydroxybutyrate) depolymerase